MHIKDKHLRGKQPDRAKSFPADPERGPADTSTPPPPPPPDAPASGGADTPGADEFDYQRFLDSDNTHGRVCFGISEQTLEFLRAGDFIGAMSAGTFKVRRWHGHICMRALAVHADASRLPGMPLARVVRPPLCRQHPRMRMHAPDGVSTVTLAASAPARVLSTRRTRSPTRACRLHSTRRSGRSSGCRQGGASAVPKPTARAPASAARRPSSPRTAGSSAVSTHRTQPRSARPF